MSENGRNGSGVELATSHGEEIKVNPADIMIALARAGFTNEQIAESFGMTPGKFAYLLLKNPDLKEAMDAAKDEPNRAVEQSLFRRANGYQIKEVEKKEGRPVKVTIKEIAPDPVSCIFWLKNRDPKRWRDVVEHKHSLRDRMDRAHHSMLEKETVGKSE